jgi:hypothetical protein
MVLVIPNPDGSFLRGPRNSVGREMFLRGEMVLGIETVRGEKETNRRAEGARWRFHPVTQLPGYPLGAHDNRSTVRDADPGVKNTALSGGGDSRPDAPGES